MPHYKNAPIVEAALDLRVRFKSSPTLEVLARVGADEPAYVRSSDPGAPELSTLDQAGDGVIFRSPDNTRAFQARVTGFTYNWLQPYQSWDPLRDEARRIWSRYRTITQPDAVDLIGLHYVNRIDLPNNSELDEYFLTRPEIGTKLPQTLDAFNMQLLFPVPTRNDARLYIVIGSVTPEKENTVSVALDIQVYEYISSDLSDASIWTIIEVFRTEKNKAFEACITDALRERIR